MSAFTIENRNCVWCGKSFVARRPDNIYCSNKCGTYSHRARQDRLNREMRGGVTVPKLRRSRHQYFDEAGWRAMAKEKNARLDNHPHAVKLPKGFHVQHFD